MKKIKSFDGLRGIFAILIFLNHSNFMDSFGYTGFFEKVFHNGSYCVIFFFVLSGFCTFIGYEDRFRELSIDKCIAFMKSKWGKLFFPYMISMIWVFAYRCVVLKESIKTCFMKLVLAGTMLQTVTVKYWDVLNSAAWFIATLWIIYWIAPFVVFAVGKIKKKNALFFLLIVSYTISILIRIFLVGFVAEQGIVSLEIINLICYVSPFVRVFDFIIGVTLGAMYTKSAQKQNSFTTAKEILAVIFVGITWFVALNSSLLEKWSYCYAMVAVCNLIYIFAYDAGGLSGLLQSRCFKFIGKYSMGIYLFHYTVIWYGGWQLCQKIIVNYNILTLLITVLMMFCVTISVSLGVSFVHDKLKRMINI